jgi:hypothetical protein
MQVTKALLKEQALIINFDALWLNKEHIFCAPNLINYANVTLKDWFSAGVPLYNKLIT